MPTIQPPIYHRHYNVGYDTETARQSKKRWHQVALVYRYQATTSATVCF